MKRYLLATVCLPFVLMTPAIADDFKPEASKILESVKVCYTKQDAACVAALYAKDPVWVNSASRTDPLSAYTKTFKAGFNKLEGAVDEAFQVDNDTPAAVGKFHITGKNDKGEAVDAQGIWTAVYVKEDTDWKIKMLTAAVTPPPPPKEASADKK